MHWPDELETTPLDSDDASRFSREVLFKFHKGIELKTDSRIRLELSN
jgi:hypothetical protein